MTTTTAPKPTKSDPCVHCGSTRSVRRWDERNHGAACVDAGACLRRQYA